MKFNIEKRVFVVKTFYKLGSFIEVRRAFKKNYNTKQVPSNGSIQDIINTFEKTGAVGRIPPKPKKISEKRLEAIEPVQNLISSFPSLSVRKMASAVGVSTKIVITILNDDLHLKPYKLQEWHRLETHDYEKRMDFARWCIEMGPYFKNWLICSDEAYFYLTLPLNHQNNREWLEFRPMEGIETPLNDEKILIWCGMSEERIYGPYYFETSVNQHNYLELLKWFYDKHRKVKDYKNYYFQQDGATPHTANMVQQWLTSKFNDKFIAKQKWPPRSPDLNPCDYFLWGYLKGRVYNPLPKTLNDLKVNIEREIKNINKEMLKKVFVNFEKRCKLIISAEGGHIEEK